jgi:tocopherol O-methyltransferase
VQRQDIRNHYNLSTVFYRLLWGRHIHHGLWSDDELAANSVAATSTVAQQRLTETLAAEAGIRSATGSWTWAVGWVRRRFIWRQSCNVKSPA